jgi:hypothetical protein
MNVRRGNGKGASGYAAQRKRQQNKSCGNRKNETHFHETSRGSIKRRILDQYRFQVGLRSKPSR